jgi:hypothetical protein
MENRVSNFAGQIADLLNDWSMLWAHKYYRQGNYQVLFFVSFLSIATCKNRLPLLWGTTQHRGTRKAEKQSRG